MIKDMRIERVDHPRADLMFEMGKPTTYIALTWTDISRGYDTGRSHLNVKYATETLKDYLRVKQITTLEYLEALTLLREYNGKEETY